MLFVAVSSTKLRLLRIVCLQRASLSFRVPKGFLPLTERDCGGALYLCAPQIPAFAGMTNMKGVQNESNV